MATSERRYESAVTVTADEQRRTVALGAAVLLFGVTQPASPGSARAMAAVAIAAAEVFEEWLRS